MSALRLLFLAMTAIVFQTESSGQTYLPIVKEGAEWHQGYVGGAFPDPPIYSNWSYHMSGDTVFSADVYKKVYRTENGLTEYHCALREDSGRVYCVPFLADSVSGTFNVCDPSPGAAIDSLIIDGEGEFLLFDFNLNPGDTIYGIIIDQVDSVDLGDGILRKRLYLNDYSIWGGVLFFGGTRLVEGIGLLKGLLELGCMQFENEFRLNCYVDSSLMYPDSCLYYLNVEDWLSEDDALDIHPNPTSGMIRLSYSGSELSNNVVIYSLTGNKVLTSPWQRGLDVSALPDGIYLLQVQLEDGRLANKKLVVKH